MAPLPRVPLLVLQDQGRRQRAVELRHPARGPVAAAAARRAARHRRQQGARAGGDARDVLYAPLPHAPRDGLRVPARHLRRAARDVRHAPAAVPAARGRGARAHARGPTTNGPQSRQSRALGRRHRRGRLRDARPRHARQPDLVPTLHDRPAQGDLPRARPAVLGQGQAELHRPPRGVRPTALQGPAALGRRRRDRRRRRRRRRRRGRRLRGRLRHLRVGVLGGGHTRNAAHQAARHADKPRAESTKRLCRGREGWNTPRGAWWRR
mmetsp:Transcript_14428/g.57498  ORF Transcript_14428/g.57498 Transcript_14428/m.57498 type:complete len:266 (+) Transcript_14428:1199-1996(+)